MTITFTHALEYEIDAKKIIKTAQIGKDSKPIGFQPKGFENKPIIFCPYRCTGYPQYYGDSYNRPRIEFETETTEYYASPCDTQEFLRGGVWIPGHEIFLFPTLEEMLKTYPSSDDFKIAFQKFFTQINPQKIYPHFKKREAELHKDLDYCLKDN